MSATLRKAESAMPVNSVAARLTRPKTVVDPRCTTASTAVNEPESSADASPDAVFFDVVSDGRKDSAIADDLGLDKGHYSRMKSGTAALPFYLLFRLTPSEWLRLRARLDAHHGTTSEAEQAEVQFDQVMTAIEGIFAAARMARNGGAQ